MARRILIIDDEEDMQVYMKTVFRKAGYEVSVAVNGEEALDKLGEFKPELITLDILMPRKSGLNFFKSLRESDATKNIPVIVISGIAQHDEFFEKEIEKDRTAYMEKPIEPDILLRKVKEMIG